MKKKMFVKIFHVDFSSTKIDDKKIMNNSPVMYRLIYKNYLNDKLL